MMVYSPTMYTGEDVFINGIPLNSIDEMGCRWIVTDIDGWWGLPDPEVPDDKRPFSEDGSYYTAGRYGPRNITVSGHIVPRGDNPGAAVEARNALSRALNLVRSTGILRVDEGPSKQARVQLVGRPLTRFNKANNDLEFNFQLRAADPRKYALTESVHSSTLPKSAQGRTYNKTFNYSYGKSGVSGVLTVDNEGSYTTFGTLRITGPVNNPSIENVEQNATLAFNISLLQNDWLDINLQARTILLNGTASRRHSLTPSSRWFSIEPGRNTLRYNGIQTIEATPATPEMYNLATTPIAVANSFKWNYQPGANEASTTTFISTGGSGPEGRSSYMRRTINTPKTGNATGIFYREPVSGSTGTTWTMSIWVRYSFDATVTPNMSFRANSTDVSLSLGASRVVPANTWTRISHTGTADANYTEVQFWPMVSASVTPPAGATYDAADVLFQRDTQLWPYFDGSMTSIASWTGAVNNSTSFARERTLVPASMVYLTYRSAWIE